MFPCFRRYVATRFGEAIDPETKVSGLRIDSSWRDAGGNRHGAIRAVGTRRDESGLIGGVVVLLIRTKSFRGTFWSRVTKYTDSDYYEAARSAFYQRDYPEFLRLAAYLSDHFAESAPLQKMTQIAMRRETSVGE